MNQATRFTSTAVVPPPAAAAPTASRAASPGSVLIPSPSPRVAPTPAGPTLKG
jgi:hypothetical protein